MKKKFVVIDGHHLMYRAYYAIRDLSTSRWEKVNAVYGFASMIMNIIERENPDYLACTFDIYKSFRHDMDSDYKAQRKKTPEDLLSQYDIVYKMVEAMWLATFACDWYEADDVIWTICTINSQQEDLLTYVVTWDMDAMQLVKDRKVIIAFPNKGYKDPIYFTEEAVLSKYWITPHQIALYKAIAWDSSDNIKWIVWIWEGWAKKLIATYGTIENILANLESLSWKTKQAIISSKDSISKLIQMVTICTNVPLPDYSLDRCRFRWIAHSALDYFNKYEFTSLIKRLDRLTQKVDTDNQMTLF